MNKLRTENFFNTTVLAEVSRVTTGEIAIQLAREPVGNFGFIVLDYTNPNKREEIFYHRKVGSTVYVYGINRSNPVVHNVNSQVQMNDTAGLFNFLSDNSFTHFYTYRKDEDNVYVFGGRIMVNGVERIVADKSLTIVDGQNYIYIDENYVLQISTTPVTDVTVSKVTRTGGNVNIEKYNLVGFGEKGEKGDKGDQGEQGIQGIQGIQGTQGIQGLKGDKGDKGDKGEDGVVLPLPTYTITNTSEDRLIDRNNTTIGELLNVTGTLYNDIKEGLEAIGIPGQDGIDGTDGKGILSITLVSTIGKVKTYRITYTDNTTFDYDVTDGADGTGGDMYKSDNLSGLTNYTTARTNLGVDSSSEVDAKVGTKQDTLINQTNIKSINGVSLLGSGDIVIATGSSTRKVVAATGGDYTTIEAAITAGFEYLYIKNGTYNENIITSAQGLDIECEEGVTINFSLTSGQACFTQGANTKGFKIKGGTINITETNGGTVYLCSTTYNASLFNRYFILEGVTITLIKNSAAISTLGIFYSSNGSSGSYPTSIKSCRITDIYGTGSNRNSIDIIPSWGEYINMGLMEGTTIISNCTDTLGYGRIYVYGVTPIRCTIETKGEPAGTNRGTVSIQNPIYCNIIARKFVIIGGIALGTSVNVIGTADNSYDSSLGGTSYRIDVQRSISCSFEVNRSADNAIKINSDFTSNRVLGGNRILIYESTNTTYGYQVTGNHFNQSLGQSTINTTIELGQAQTSFTGNTIIANWLASGSNTSTLLLNSDADHSIVSGNVFKRWGSNAWVQTNNSTGSLIANNIFANV